MDLPDGAWRKIFLFYGMIFFLLGLMGQLSCAPYFWENFSAGLSRVRARLQAYADWRGELSEATAPLFEMKNGAEEVCLVYPVELQSSLGILFLKRKLAERFNKVRLVPVKNPAIFPEYFFKLAACNRRNLIGADYRDDAQGNREARFYYILTARDRGPQIPELPVLSARLGKAAFFRYRAREALIHGVTWQSYPSRLTADLIFLVDQITKPDYDRKNIVEF